MTWKPNSWRNYPVVQMPTYPDESKVNSVETKLSFKPPLVFAGGSGFEEVSSSRGKEN